MNDTNNNDLEGMRQIANMIDIDAAADQAAQDEADQAEMVDATIHRGVSCQKMPKLVEPGAVPVCGNFTEIRASCTQDGECDVRVLDAGTMVTVAKNVSLDEGNRIELAINQAMVEYRAKRNAWEKELVANAD